VGTLRAKEIFNDARIKVIAVESVDVQPSKANNSCQLYGNIEPIAIIICGPDTTYALDIEAKPTPFDQLIRDIPELGSMIVGSFPSSEHRYSLI